LNPTFRFLLSFLFLSLLAVLVLFSCKKDPYEIGIDLLPPSDTINVKTIDTCTVTACTVRLDSIHTSNCSALTLGSLSDPVFGNSTIGFYTQLFPSSASVEYGTAPVVDSIILMLYYSGYYGDTTTQQRIRVWELAEDIHSDSAYFSNRQMQVYPNLLADMTFKPRPKDSVKVGSTNYAAHLRVNLGKITSYFGNKLLSGPPSVYSSSALFSIFMKGLYIETVPVNYGGALLNFDISNSTTKMVMYFHNQAQDSLSYTFLLDPACARFLHIDHNQYFEASQELKQQALNHDSLLGKEMLYLEGLGGMRIKFRMPNIMSFGKNRKIAINDALLLFKDATTDTTLQPPAKLVLMRDSAGIYKNIIDELEGTAYFGGIYNKTTQTYYFRLTRYVQKMITGYYATNPELYIMANDPSSAVLYPNRVRVNGYNPSLPGASASRFRLQITYTILH
jgi:hypothetical protein